MSRIRSFLGVQAQNLWCAFVLHKAFCHSILFFSLLLSIFCNSTLKVRLSPSTRLLANKQCSVRGPSRNRRSEKPKNLSKAPRIITMFYVGSRDIITWHACLMESNICHFPGYSQVYYKTLSVQLLVHDRHM